MGSGDVWTAMYGQAAEAAERARQEHLNRAQTAYQGDAAKPLRQTPDGFDDNVRLNYARLIVDKGVSFMYGNGPDWTVDTDEAATDTVEQDAKDLWEANGGLLTQMRFATNGGVCGHAFLRLIDSRPWPRIVPLDPASVTLKWKDDDHETITEFWIEWTTYDAEARKAVARRQRILQEAGQEGRAWTIVDEVSTGGGRWRELEREIHPFDWPPIFHCQNLPTPGVVWGRADLEDDVLDLIETIEFVASNVNRILRFHAHPLWYTDGEGDLSTLDRAIGRIVKFPKGTTIDRLEMDSDLSSSTDFLRLLLERLHELTRIPEVATGRLDGVGSLSGVALAILYQPLTELTATKREGYGGVLADVTSKALLLAGKGDHRVVVSWPEMLPADVESLLADQTMGIASKRTLAEKRGYDWEVESARMEDEGAPQAEAAQDAVDQLVDRMQTAPGPMDPGVDPTAPPPRGLPPGRMGG